MGKKPEDKKVEVATKEDTDAIFSAVQELTKVIGELTKENVKWYRAGKMALPYVLTTFTAYAAGL